MYVPEYVNETVSGAVSRIKNLLYSGNTYAFAFLTDVHNCITLCERSVYAINEIAKSVPVSFACFGGDYLCNNVRTCRDEALFQHREFKSAIEKLNIPAMIVNGNHDDNPFGEAKNRLYPDEIYDIIMAHHSAQFVTDSPEKKGMYGYFDDEKSKVRSIFINVMDAFYEKRGDEVFVASEDAFAINNAQMNFIANKALVLPGSGWAVQMFAHTPPIPMPFGADAAVFGGNTLFEIIRAFKSGKKYSASEEKGKLFYDATCDYTNQGKSDFIGFFCGHYHCDWVSRYEGVNFVTHLAAASDNFTTCMCGDGRLHQKVRGSGEESAFSVYVVNRDEKKVYCIRCGAGPDYNFTY